jgi:hypothetical protein
MADLLEVSDLSDPKAAQAVDVLERGGLVLFPNLPFEIEAGETALINPSILSGASKNVSYDPSTDRIGGSSLEDVRLAACKAMIKRYAARADAILASVTPRYGPHLQKKRTSFRPGAIETRALSPRKDDKRLHVDAFPASPVQGRRIFRVFTNADPTGKDRIWNLGDQDFEAFSTEYGPRVKPRAAGAWREALGLTRGRRTAYDSVMLQLHDRAKLDDGWQASAPKTRLTFPAGSTWMVYTDSVLHAALGGQHAFEQTYLMPVAGMADERRSPLRILERLTGRPLV